MTSCTPGYAGGYLLCASTCTGAEKGLLLQLQRPPVGGDDGVHGGGAQAALLQRPYTGDGGAAGGAYLILHQAEGLAALVTSDKNKPTTYGITDIPYKDDDIDMETVGENAIRRVFDDVEDIEGLIAMLREQNGRYANSQMNKIVSLAKVYTVDQVESAILYCIRVKKCSLNEVQAYLLYRYGLGMAKRKMSEHALYHCKKRAEEIAEEQNRGCWSAP